MLNRSVIALAAAVFLGSASAALSYEDPENQIGDRYPFLERTPATALAISSGTRVRTARRVAPSAAIQVEDVENQIADRYPLLEPVAPGSRRVAAGRYLAARYAANVSPVLIRWEDPENRIADRYPFLEERRIVSRRAARVAARTSSITGSIR